MKKEINKFLYFYRFLATVKEIRKIYKSHDKKYGMIPLAKKYNVSTSTIDKCVHYRSYKNVK